MRRRDFLLTTAAGATAAATTACWTDHSLLAQVPGVRPPQAAGVKVLNPGGRVPVSLIIDDSTCLVNLNRFAIPQFAAAWKAFPERKWSQPWRKMPHEIPDSFVRKFGQWCAENGVKGKYSVVPFPACVGRVDRVLPGWTARELNDSLKLVRDELTPNWDIHPEMVTHTRVINTKTGHPYPQQDLQHMENWRWTDGKSVDELANYMSYGLNILRNVGLPCEGLTTPGGFASRVLPELAQATLESCRDVYQTEIPHYFRHLYADGERSVAPRVEYAAGLDTDDPRCVVSIVGCTGDWTGGWDCSSHGDLDRFINADLTQGRMIDVIERGEPAIIVCHWTGIYFNGEEIGFHVFQEVVRRLHAKYDHLQWMKLSEISRYWAAKELTQWRRPPGNPAHDAWNIHAPFACPQMTVGLPAAPGKTPRLAFQGQQTRLTQVKSAKLLKAGTWFHHAEQSVVCFDLPRGGSQLKWV